MLWTYCREGCQIYYEIRQALDSDGFELVLKYPDGSERCEAFDDPKALERRASEVESFLSSDGWHLAGDPRR
jgi:hypothetical protein